MDQRLVSLGRAGAAQGAGLKWQQDSALPGGHENIRSLGAWARTPTTAPNTSRHFFDLAKLNGQNPNLGVIRQSVENFAAYRQAIDASGFFRRSGPDGLKTGKGQNVQALVAQYQVAFADTRQVDLAGG